MSGRVVLVGGGARSGKSRFALGRARAFGPRLAFVATARASDAEMADRIARHRAERLQEYASCFTTFEEPVAIAELLRGLRGFDGAVVDCLTLWLSNLVLDASPIGPDGAVGAQDERQVQTRIETQVETLAAALRELPCPVVLVTNEVGMGIHPETALGRLFRDLAGRANQRLAAAADELHFAVLGTVIRLKPAPLDVHYPGAPA